MEGLLPLIFKAIKKNRTRRQYECLSSRADLNCNAAGFFAHGQSEAYQTPPPQNGHRRHKSVGDFAYGFSPPQPAKYGDSPSPTPTPKQLVRFGSQRMFSCITGV